MPTYPEICGVGIWMRMRSLGWCFCGSLASGIDITRRPVTRPLAVTDAYRGHGLYHRGRARAAAPSLRSGMRNIDSREDVDPGGGGGHEKNTEIYIALLNRITV